MNAQQVSIHVFRRSASGVQYLVTRRRPRAEFDWGVATTTIRPVETVGDAARRCMAERWQAPAPSPWVDLRFCAAQHVGDLDLMQWAVGYGVDTDWDPSLPDPVPVGGTGERRWVPLIEAYRLLRDDARRQALFRLHTELGAAS